jgi:hypothetical protein
VDDVPASGPPQQPSERPSGAELPRRRELLDTGFGDDDGAAAPDVVAALGRYQRDRSVYLPTLEALQDARLLVPVVAVLGETEEGPDGLNRDKSSDMATVLMTSSAGRTALLAFTSMETLHTWRADGRPVPTTVPVAARSALQDGADVLLVDVAGPVRFVVEPDDLRALADGFRLVPVGQRLAWAKAVPTDPDVG